MQQRTDRIHSAAPLKNNELKQRIEKNLNDVNSFIN